jgi:beta-lactamase regulating signal transducer with metallopeptidase domain
MAWAADARWLGLLAEYLVKTTAVLSLALAAAALLRRRSAALRHFVLSAFLVGLVLLPLLPSLPTGWETRWLPARPAVQGAPPAVPNGGATWAVGVPLKVAEPLTIAETARAAEPLSGRSATGIPLASRTADSGVQVRTAEEAPAAGVRAAAVIEKFLPLAWLAGLLLLLLRLGLGLAGAARLSREGRPLDDSVWEALLRRFLALVTLRRRVRLKSHGRVAIPMTWGVVRPVILFPEDSRDWDEGRRSAALFHELSHIKRADFAVMLLVRLSLALFWFNPLVWAVFRRLRREQEKACDELVLKAGIKPSAYARSLLLFRRAAAGAWGPSAALLGLASGSSLDERLAAILRQKLTIKEITMKTRIILTVAVFSLVSLIGSARPAAQTAAAPAAAASVAAAPAPVQEVAAASQEKQAAEKEKQAAQAEKKAKEKEKLTKTIVISTSEAKEGQILITVSEGDKTKTLVLDDPVILEAGGSGESVTLRLDGKDIVLKTGEKLTLVSKGSSVKLIQEGEVHEHAVAAPVIIEVGEATPGMIIIKEAPHAVTVKEVMAAPAAVPATPAPPGVPAPPAAPAAPAKATTYEVIQNGKAYTIVMSPRQPHPPYPQAVTYSVVPGYEIDLGRKEIRRELQAIQEQVKKLEQRRPDVSDDLKGIEESLQALTEKLEKQAAKLEAYRIKEGVPLEHGAVAVPGEHITIVGKDAAAGEALGVVYSDAAEKAHVVSVTRGEVGAITVIYKTGEVLKDEAAVARAVDKVKKALPQGYTVEPKADKESGTLTLKIKAPDGQKVDEGLARKIVSILVEELKKDPGGKN